MSKKINKLAVGVATLGLLASCSSNWRRSESIEEKMARYKSTAHDRNIIPDYMVLNKKFSSRTPASVRSKKVDRGLTNHSNKRLYFLSLYTQYNDLKKYSTSEVAPKINYCPSFHTSFVDHNEKYETSLTRSASYKVNDKIQANIKDDNFIAFYPELSLPVTADSQHPRVVDILRSSKHSNKEASELINKSINIHLSKTYNELMELCETGSSSNYYTYENLMTHVKRKGPLRGSKSSAKILLKTTVFSNIALIKSLDAAKGPSRGIASTVERSPYQAELADRLNIRWSKNYLKAIKNKR